MRLAQAWPPDSRLPQSREALRVYLDPPPLGINNGYLGLAYSPDDAHQRLGHFGKLRLEGFQMPRGDVEKALGDASPSH